jgi:hypothetical protein
MSRVCAFLVQLWISVFYLLLASAERRGRQP